MCVSVQAERSCCGERGEAGFVLDMPLETLWVCKGQWVTCCCDVLSKGHVCACVRVCACV